MALNADDCAQAVVDEMEAAGKLSRDMTGPGGDPLFATDADFEDAKAQAKENLLPLITAILTHIADNAEVTTTVATTGTATTTGIADTAGDTLVADAPVSSSGTGTGGIT